MLLVGYFDYDLTSPEGEDQDEEISVAFVATVLEFMLAHFLSRRCPWCQYGRTWSMVQLGR